MWQIFEIFRFFVQFGGKLVTFCNDNTSVRNVHVKHLITEPKLIERSTQLENVLSNGNFADFCRQKADEMSDQHNRYVWYFLKANFEQDPRGEMLNLLGKKTTCFCMERTH